MSLFGTLGKANKMLIVLLQARGLDASWRRQQGSGDEPGQKAKDKPGKEL